MSTWDKYQAKEFWYHNNLIQVGLHNKEQQTQPNHIYLIELDIKLDQTQLNINHLYS